MTKGVPKLIVLNCEVSKLPVVNASVSHISQIILFL